MFCQITRKLSKMMGTCQKNIGINTLKRVPLAKSGTIRQSEQCYGKEIHETNIIKEERMPILTAE